MLVDTHIHLYAEEYDADRESLMVSAAQSGVSKFLLPNIDADSLVPMLRLCERHPSTCYPMFGLHPCYVKEDFREQLELVKSALDRHAGAAVAIGEIGLDLHWDTSFRKEQEQVFLTQLGWAAERGLPVSMHTRNATEETLQLIRRANQPGLKGVFHCFSGTLQQATEAIGLGFMIGIGGVVTFKNSGLDQIVNTIPMSAIVLETDGPYLAPAPHRGRRNQPAYLRLVAEKVAVIRKITLEEVCHITTENALGLFKSAA
jgi:TatD DNase family protein